MLMNNLVVLPILIPLLSGIIFILLRHHIRWQRYLSVITTLANAAVAVYIGHVVYQDGILVLEMGGWSAPFGIVLVADLFAIILVLTSTLVSAACLWYAFRSIEHGREAYFFYPL